MAVKNVSLESIGNILKTPFITLSSKNLIKAGWKGDIKDFSQKLWKYRWRGTRDYTMAVIILTIVVAASKATDITVSANKRDAKGKKIEKKDANGKKIKNDEEISLADYINRKVSAQKIADLFEKIVDIWVLKHPYIRHNIAKAITYRGSAHGWFPKCFISLLLASKNDREEAEKVFDEFLKQVNKMTSWKINESYIQELTKIINKLLMTNMHPTSDAQPEGEGNSTSEQDEKEKKEEELRKIWKPIKKYTIKEEQVGGKRGKVNFSMYGDRIYARFGPKLKAETGWKLHISPKPLYAVRVFEILFKLQKSMNFTGKYVYNDKIYQRLFTTGNQAGKFITIYPESDDQSKKIAESFHKAFEKEGMSESCFIKIDNDFKVYPGIYTRLCDYGDEVSKGSRYNFYIPKKVFDKHIKKFEKKSEEYEHPFEKLSFGGVELPKKVSDINGGLNDSVVKWEWLTDLSQIPDEHKFEPVTLMGTDVWEKLGENELVAIAKITLNSICKILFIPDNIENYKLSQFLKDPTMRWFDDGIRYHSYIKDFKEKMEQVQSALQNGKQQTLIKLFPLDNHFTKSKIRISPNPQEELEDIITKLEEQKQHKEQEQEQKPADK